MIGVRPKSESHHRAIDSSFSHRRSARVDASDRASHDALGDEIARDEGPFIAPRAGRRCSRW